MSCVMPECLVFCVCYNRSAMSRVMSECLVNIFLLSRTLTSKQLLVLRLKMLSSYFRNYHRLAIRYDIVSDVTTEQLPFVFYHRTDNDNIMFYCRVYML